MTIPNKLSASDLLPELEFSASKSSGPGGQNVNKVNTKISLRFDIPNSAILNEDQKNFLLKKLRTKVTLEGVVIINDQSKRSQLQNKESAVAKLDKLLSKAFEVRKKRKPTKPTRSSVRKRLDSKKKHSIKKQSRQIPPDS